MNCYKYYDSVLRRELLGEDHLKPVIAINNSGGKGSLKTSNALEYMLKCDLIANQKEHMRVCNIVFRLNNKDVTNIFDEMTNNVTHRYHVPDSYWRVSKPHSTYELRNTYCLGIFRGIYVGQNKDAKKALKGFRSFENYDLVNILIDEASELSTEEYAQILGSVRGAKKSIIIRTANPDNPLRPYIKEVVKNLVPNHETMVKTGSQIKYDYSTDGVTIWHNTNFMVNPYLHADYINNLLRLKVLDPDLAMAYVDGMPTNLSGTVFARYMVGNFWRNIDFHPLKFRFGLDMGISDHKTAHNTALVIVAENNIANRIHQVDKGTHNPRVDKHLNLAQKYLEIVNQVKLWIHRYHIIEKVVVHCDSGGQQLSFIDGLNRTAYELGLENEMYFNPVFKEMYYVVDRVHAIIILMNSGVLTFNKHLEAINFEGPMIRGADSTSETYSKPQIVDANDNEFDALYYACADIIRPYVQNVNTLVGI